MPLDIWRAAYEINPRTDGVQSDPQITQLANGNILVVWQTPGYRDTGNPPYDSTVAHIYDPLGNLISDEFFLHGGYFNNGEFFTQPTLSSDVSAIASGGFVSVILRDVAPSDVRLITYDDSGNATFASYLTDDSNSVFTYSDPQVVTSSNSSSLITYLQDQGTGNMQVIGRIYNPSTNSLTLQINFIEEPGDIFTYDTAVLSNGNYLIVSHSSAGADGLYMRIIDASGGNVLSTTAVENTIADSEFDGGPQIVALTGGGFAIAWVNIDGPSGGDSDINMRAYDAGGTPVGDLVGFSSGEFDNHFLFEMIPLSDGGFLMLNSDTAGLGLNAREYSATGGLQDTFVIETDNVSNVEAVLLADGRIAITYNKNFEVFMQILDPRDGPNTTGASTSDYIVGTAGNDDITENSSNLHFGWEGNDVIRVQAGTTIGTDEYDGGTGIDTMNFSGSTESLATFNLDTGIVTTSNDVDHVMANFENFVGTSQSDIIILTTDDNQVYAGTGNDEIFTPGGVDQIYGEAGIDTIYVTGVSLGGGSYFDGGLDNDTFDFSNLNSNYSANLTTITFSGVSTSVIINFENVYGGAGDDMITGDLNDNILSGGDGNDTIETVGGLDILQGGTGHDILLISAVTLSGGRSFAGGIGTDTLSFAGLQSGYLANLTTNIFSRLNGAAPNSLDSIEDVIGGNGADWIVGSSESNILRGGDGNDALEGMDEDDYLWGGNGNDDLFGGNDNDELNGGDGDDILNGGNGADTLLGGAGDDVIATGFKADIVDGGAGIDTVDYSLSDFSQTINLTSNVNINGHANGDVLTSVENVLGSNTRKDDITGNLLDNILDGQGGNDILRGGRGDDTMLGGDGKDALYGGKGADVHDGGDGRDWAKYNGSSAFVDVDLVSGGTAGIALGDTYFNIENVRGTDFGDTILGNDDDNKVIAGQGDDIVNGRGGKDTLQGNDGNDTITGGTGNDTMRGQAGDDIFVYSIGDGVDKILDFDDFGDDQIDLSSFGFASFAEVQAIMSQSGSRVILDFAGANVLRLENTDLADMGADDFILTGGAAEAPGIKPMIAEVLDTSDLQQDLIAAFMADNSVQSPVTQTNAQGILEIMTDDEFVQDWDGFAMV